MLNPAIILEIDSMNTIKSTWIGWGTLILAGGGAYIFAKRSVNEKKQARFEEEMKRMRLKASLEAEFLANSPSTKRSSRKTHDHASSPNTEAANDPPPTEHLLENGDQKLEKGNNFVATKPYRSKRGDRFS